MQRPIKGRMHDAWQRVAAQAGAWVLAAILVWVVGCAVDNDDGLGPNPPGSTTGTCKDCHLSKEMLVATAAPDTTPPAEDPGEG